MFCFGQKVALKNFLLIVGLWSYTIASGQTLYEWVGGFSTEWSDSRNWSPTGVPGEDDDAWINYSPNYQPVISNEEIKVHSVFIYNLGTSSIFDGKLTITNSGTLTVVAKHDEHEASAEANGCITISNNGILENRGVINVYHNPTYPHTNAIKIRQDGRLSNVGSLAEVNVVGGVTASNADGFDWGISCEGILGNGDASSSIDITKVKNGIGIDGGYLFNTGDISITCHPDGTPEDGAGLVYLRDDGRTNTVVKNVGQINISQVQGNGFIAIGDSVQNIGQIDIKLVEGYALACQGGNFTNLQNISIDSIDGGGILCTEPASTEKAVELKNLSQIDITNVKGNAIRCAGGDLLNYHNISIDSINGTAILCTESGEFRNQAGGIDITRVKGNAIRCEGGDVWIDAEINIDSVDGTAIVCAGSGEFRNRSEIDITHVKGNAIRCTGGDAWNYAEINIDSIDGTAIVCTGSGEFRNKSGEIDITHVKGNAIRCEAGDAWNYAEINIDSIDGPAIVCIEVGEFRNKSGEINIRNLSHLSQAILINSSDANGSLLHNDSLGIIKIFPQDSPDSSLSEAIYVGGYGEFINECSGVLNYSDGGIGYDNTNTNTVLENLGWIISYAPTATEYTFNTASTILDFGSGDDPIIVESIYCNATETIQFTPFVGNNFVGLPYCKSFHFTFKRIDNQETNTSGLFEGLSPGSSYDFAIVLKGPEDSYKVDTFTYQVGVYEESIAATVSCLDSLTTQEEVDFYPRRTLNRKFISGDLFIGLSIGATAITNLDSLIGIQEIVGNLTIESNDALTDISGLDNLRKIGNDLAIINNASLDSLQGLQNLDSIGGDLRITFNKNLKDLSHLAQLESIGDDLEIRNNLMLAYCSIESICTYLESTDSVLISGNGFNLSDSLRYCSTQDDVEFECFKCQGPFIHLLTQSAVDSFTIKYGCDSILGELIIGPALSGSSSNITNLDSLIGVRYVGSDLDILNNNSLSSLAGLDNLQFVGRRLEIVHNNSLINFTGLGNLDSIVGIIYISGDSSLVNFTGLGNLKYVGGALVIQSNPALKTFEGLESLNSAGGFYIVDNDILVSLSGLENLNPIRVSSMTIKENDILSECAIEPVCQYLDMSNVTTNIQNNASGCDSVGEINRRCNCMGSITLSTQSGIDSFAIYYGCDSIGGDLYISGESADSSITNLDSLLGIRCVDGHLDILNNDSLSSLAGLDSVQFISGNLNIRNNAALTTTVPVFLSLETIDGDFTLSASKIRINPPDSLTINGQLLLELDAQIILDPGCKLNVADDGDDGGG